MKKFISVVVSICMILSCLPILSFADVKYPQEVTVFDSGETSFKDNANGLRNDFGIFKITSADNNTIDESGNIVLGGSGNSGAQFEVDSTSDRLKTLTKNGATLKVSVSVKINESAAGKPDKPIISLRAGDNATLNLFEYNSKKEGETPQFRGFSSNYKPKLVLERDNVAGTEITVDASINTKTQFGRVIFSGKDGKGNAISGDSGDFDFSPHTAGDGTAYSLLKENGVSLVRCFLNPTDVIKSFKITVTDLSTDSLYESINTTANAEEVKEVLDYYSKNSSFSYGDRFDELSDGEKSEIYGNFINKNFASDSEIQALFDKLVAKKFSIITKTYTYDFENGENPFSKGSIQTLSDGNKVFVPVGSDASQLKPSNLANIACGPVVTEYDYCFNGDETGSEYGLALRYLAANGTYYLNQFTKFSNFYTGDKKSTEQHLGYKTFYRIRQSLDTETITAALSAKEASSSSDFTKFTFDGNYFYTPTTNNGGPLFEESAGNIVGIDMRSGRTDDYIDNLTIKVYNPVYTALSYTETADEVKNVFDIYSSLGSIDTDYDSEYEVNYDKVYEAFIGSSNYSSTKALQDAFNAECENNLIYSDYETELGAYSGGEKVSYFDKDNSFNAKASIISRVDGDDSAVLVCAQYSNDGTLIDVWTDTKPLTNGVKADLSVTPDITTVTDTYMKLMLLNSLDNLKPYCKSKYVRASEADKKTTVYLVGDSLCANYDTRTFAEGGKIYPYQGWGYYLAESFNNVTVVNHAVSGWTTEHFVHPENWDVASDNPNVWANFKDDIQPGDYVIIGLGINDSGNKDTGEVRVTEERFKENLNKMYTDATNAGATVIFATPTISGGTEGTETGWKYSLSNLWAARGEVTREFAESKGAVCLQLGKTLSETYEAMYQQYKTDNPSATDIEARDYVRHWFHLYISTVKSEWGLTDDQINLHNGSIKGGKDDSTHMNMRGAKKCAEIIAGLIRASGSSLGDRYKN